MDELTLPDTLNVATAYVDANIVAGRGPKTAFFYHEQQFTYQDVLDQVNRTGNALQALGLEVEQRVALLLLDCPEFVYSFFGAMKIGAVAVPMNTLLRPADYSYLLNDSRAKVLIVSESLLPQIEAIRQELNHLRQIIVVGKAGPHLSYDRLLAEASSTLEATPMSKDDMAFWLYSSGSTGFPKGAVHLHHDMLYVSDLAGKQIMQITEADRTFSAAKLFFAYGLGNAGYFPMGAGAQSVLYPHRPTPDAVFEVIARHRPTLFFGIPTLYAAMLAIKEAEKRWDVSSLRLCVSAGEALPEELYNRWRERFGVEIIDGIGTTEILHIFLSNRPGASRPGSTGLPVPGYDATVVDDDGRPVKHAVAGRLRVKSAAITSTIAET